MSVLFCLWDCANPKIMIKYTVYVLVLSIVNGESESVNSTIPEHTLREPRQLLPKKIIVGYHKRTGLAPVADAAQPLFFFVPQPSVAVKTENNIASNAQSLQQQYQPVPQYPQIPMQVYQQPMQQQYKSVSYQQPMQQYEHSMQYQPQHDQPIPYQQSMQNQQQYPMQYQQQYNQPMQYQQQYNQPTQYQQQYEHSIQYEQQQNQQIPFQQSVQLSHPPANKKDQDKQHNNLQTQLQESNEQELDNADENTFGEEDIST